MTNFSRNLYIEHERIDEQHQRLANFIGQIHHAMQTNAQHETMVEIFERLINATQEHFAYEENLLRQSDYPELDSHMAEHAELLRQINELHQRLSNGTLQITMHMMILLKDWLLNHVENYDRAYVNHLKSITPNNIPGGD